MPNVNFYLGQPTLQVKDKNKQAEIHRKIADYKKKGIKVPVSLLNPRETAIYLILTINRNNIIKIRTEYQIRAEDWDFVRRLPNPKKGYLELLDKLIELKSKVFSKYIKIVSEMEEFSLDTIKREITPLIRITEQKMNKNSFFDIYDLFLESLVGKDRKTIQKYNTLKSFLREFEENCKYHLNFDRIDSTFESKYRKYMIDEKEYLNGTIDKYFVCTKVFLRWAFNNNFTKNKYFEKFQYYNQDVEVITLDVEEFISVFNHKSDKENIIIAKDYFSLQTFTMQRLSDILNLDIDKDIIENKDGKLIWKLYQNKGKKTVPIEIPLNNYATEIILKYKNQNLPLPKISEGYYNKNIKLLCKEAGITKMTKILQYSGDNPKPTIEPKYKFVSSHTAKKTGINLLAQFGAQQEVVMSISGNKDRKVIDKHYRKVSDQEKWKAVEYELLTKPD